MTRKFQAWLVKISKKNEQGKIIKLDGNFSKKDRAAV